MEAELATGRVRVAAATGPEGRLTEEILGLLHKWGIHTLGQLAALKIESGAKHYNTTHSGKVRISETGVSKCSP